MSKNSFVSIAEQISLLNKNSVEIITRLNDVVQSSGSSVKVDYLKEDGTTSSYYLPTVGKLQKDINSINNSFQSLIQSDINTTYVFDDVSVKKLMTVDLNKEPNKIEGLSGIDVFTPKNNWFFEALSSPLLTVKLNLKDKIEMNVNKVLSRRYIVKFQTDSGGTMTNTGQNTMLEFKNKFVNASFSFSDFDSWINNTTNVGVDLANLNYDEQIFEFEYNEIATFGVFSVLKQETDSNNKLWLYLDTLDYYINDTNLSKKILTIGEQLILNVKYSSSRYEIKEIDNSSYNPKIRVERIEGYEPIPVANNILKIFSDINYDKNLYVSIGFNEYDVVFLKSINTDNNIISSEWSNGIAFYSNDLMLDTNSNISMAQYYLDNVYDYGALLKDLVKKLLPSKSAIKPDAPILDATNFQVVQINKHLNDPNTDDIKKLHSDKENTKSKISQLETTVQTKLNDLLKTTSTSEKRAIQLQIDSSNKEKNNLSVLLNSITKQLNSYSNNSTKIDPKYRIRGFWDFPTPKQEKGFRPQEIIQFEIYYRYSSKTGQENLTNSYNFLTTDGSTKQGNYSNWIPLKTDKRKRDYDSVTDSWIWKVEDVSDASTPNINQLDISIQENEKVEIKIRSISEIEDVISDFSEITTIEFPDDLKSIVLDTDYIYEEAKNDNLRLEFEASLDSKGVSRHLSESYYNTDEYIAHKDTSIMTGFKDENGIYFNVYEYFTFLTNRITQLEEIILQAKGDLLITLENDTESYEILNDSVNIINVDCTSKYIRETSPSTFYKNDIYTITYNLVITNNSKQSQLSFLTSYYTTYDQQKYKYRQLEYSGLTALEGKDNMAITQQDKQWIYFYDTNDTDNLYDTSGLTNYNSSIYFTNYKYNFTPVLVSKNQNIGIMDYSLYNNSSNNQYKLSSQPVEYGLSNIYTSWYYYDNSSLNYNYAGYFLSTIHPYIKDMSVIKSSSNSKVLEGNSVIKIPINIYFKFKLGEEVSLFDLNNQTTSGDINLPTYYVGDNIHEKSVKFELRVDGKEFISEIKFNLKRK